MDIKNIEDIVIFYKSVQDTNLLKVDGFSIQEYLKLEKSLSIKNQQYQSLYRDKIAKNKINVKTDTFSWRIFERKMLIFLYNYTVFQIYTVRPKQPE